MQVSELQVVGLSGLGSCCASCAAKESGGLSGYVDGLAGDDVEPHLGFLPLLIGAATMAMSAMSKKKGAKSSAAPAAAKPAAAKSSGVPIGLIAGAGFGLLTLIMLVKPKK